MLFSFTTWNHCQQGRVIVEDITIPMGHQLMALGHQVLWTVHPQFISRDLGYNIVLESFADDPATLESMRAAHANGSRFLIVATEEPTPRGFNHGVDPAMVDRQKAFPAAAALADGILHLVPGSGVTRWYSQYGRAAYAEIGYAPSLVMLPSDDDMEPTAYFGFFGKITPRRERMLAHLGEIGGMKPIRIDTLDVPRAARNQIMKHAAVIVQIMANDEWGMVSSTRCAASLSLGRPVIAEPHPYSHPWDKVVDFSESVESFYSDALAAALGDWRGRWSRQLARFKDKLSPEVCIGHPLRSIGILP